MTIRICRSRPLSVRVTDVEREALEKIARIEQLSLSEAQRLAIREAAKLRGVWASPDGSGVGDLCLSAQPVP